MDLAELRFKVDTKQLEDAAAKLEKLGTAVEKLNKPLSDLSKNTSSISIEQNKSAESATKLEKAQTKANDATKKSVSILEKQNMILEFMAQGYSRGQSSTLAMAKASGALTDEVVQLGKVLQTQRTLMGTDPFDKSIGALQSLRNEYTVIKEVQRLYTAGLALSKTQMEDLAREKLRLIEKFKLEGKTLTEVKQGLMDLNSAYIKNAGAENSIVANIKAREKALMDTAKANEYLEKAMYREIQLMNSSSDVTSTMNNKLIAFEANLKRSGKTAGEQAVELDKFRKALEANQKASGNRQVDYLSRALGPQITDIGIGLMTGQNPLTVMLQQGGQLRDQFALAGIAGKDMGKMLEVAAKNMVTSVKDVAVAMSTLVASVAMSPITTILDRYKKVSDIGTKLAEGSISQVRADRLVEVANGRLIQSFITLGSVGVAAFGVAMIMAIKEVTDQEEALNKALNLTGASLGLNQDQALTLAKTYAGAKGNIGSYVEAITEIAKAGGVTKGNLEAVATTIVEVSKVTGISSKDLAKNFSKIAEKPTESLIPFAKELGNINVAILEQVHNLELAGKHTEAAKLATDSYAKAIKEAADTIKKDMGYLETFFYNIGQGAKWMWDQILNIGRKGTLADQLKDAEKELNKLYKTLGTDLMDMNGWDQMLVTNQIELVNGIKSQIDAEQKLSDERAKNSNDALKFQKKLADTGDKSVVMPKDLALEALKKQYADQNKMIDSEFNKQQALNKSNYALGLTKEGAYLSNELALIEEQNAAKLEANDKYYVDLLRARRAQEDKINTEFGRAKGAAKTPKEVEALEKQRVAAIESTKAAYDNLNNSVKANNEVLDDNAVKSTAEAMERLGGTTKTAFENIASGANLSTMFDGALAGAGKFLTAIEDIGKSQERTAAAYSANLKNNSDDIVKFGKIQDRINTVSTYEQMKSYGDMIGGLKSYAKQGSKTYKALESAEKVYRVFQLAMSIKAAAANLMEGQTAAAAGVANQAKGEPYTAPARMAAMAAIMAAIGFTVGMIGGGDSGPAPSNMGTGTVFGDSTAKSESIGNSLSILNDIQDTALVYTQKMARSLSNIENGISGFTNILIRSSGLSNLTGSINTGTFDTALIKFDKLFYDAATYGLTKLFPSIMGPINALYSKTMQSLWGKSVSVIGSGITAAAQSLSDVLSKGFQGQYYADVQTKKKALGFTYSKSTSTSYSALDTEIENQITSILTNIADAATYGALALGKTIDEVNKDISNYIVSIGKIEVQGLTGEQIAEKLANVFGAEADKIAKALVGGLEDLQKVGEGYFETLTRVVAQLEYVNLQTSRLGSNFNLTGVAGAHAADSLVKLFGSLSDFQSAIDNFYQDFYTQEERNAKTLEELTASFVDLGLTLPTTLAGYRDLVNQQNLYTEAGQQTYATLIKLSAGFADVTKAAEDAAKANAEAVASAGKSISEWLKKLVGEVVTPQASLAATKAAYQNNLSLSRVNDQTALSNITGSADAYLAAVKASATTSAQYKLAVAQVVSQVSSLPAVKGYNDMVLEKLGLIATFTDETSSNTLDAYNAAVKQVDYLIRLNNEGLNSVYQAINQSYGYYNTMITHLSSIDSSIKTASSSGGSGGGSSGSTLGNILGSVGNLAGNTISKLSFGLFADGGVFSGQGIYNEPTMFMQPTGQFGVMGEAGPEAVMPLERLADGALGVRAVTSIGSMGDSSMLWQAIDRLNANVDGLRAETRATVVNTSKTAKLLDRVVESDTIKVQTIVV